MKKNRKALIAAMVALAVVGGLACSDDSGPSSQPAATDEALGDEALGEAAAENGDNDGENNSDDGEASWLLTQTGRAGSMTPNDDGTYQLVLDGIDPNVIAFTDRPERDTAVLTVNQLVDSWESTFADAAPNGVLVAHRPGEPADSIVVELFDPQSSGTTMTYTVRVLADENTSMKVVGDTSVAEPPIPPATFLIPSLFIDSMNLRYACLSNDGSQTELYPPGDVPAGGPTHVWLAECIAAGGGIGETFG
jgi:hypothetical protein